MGHLAEPSWLLARSSLCTLISGGFLLSRVSLGGLIRARCHCRHRAGRRDVSLGALPCLLGDDVQNRRRVEVGPIRGVLIDQVAERGVASDVVEKVCLVDTGTPINLAEALGHDLARVSGIHARSSCSPDGLPWTWHVAHEVSSVGWQDVCRGLLNDCRVFPRPLATTIAANSSTHVAGAVRSPMELPALAGPLRSSVQLAG